MKQTETVAITRDAVIYAAIPHIYCVTPAPLAIANDSLVCGGDPGQSKGRMRMDEMDRYRELIKENIDFDLLQEHPYDGETLED